MEAGGCRPLPHSRKGNNYESLKRWTKAQPCRKKIAHLEIRGENHTVKLRPYQEEGLNQIEDNFNAGTRTQVLCATTGAGKTIMFSTLAARYLKQRKRVIILTDRIELMTQTFLTFQHLDISASLIESKNKRIKKGNGLHVAMVETLYRRIQKPYNRHILTVDGPIDLVVIDECHKGNFRKILTHEFFQQSRILGVTATPLSSSKKHPLNEYFEKIVEPVTLNELIEQEFLVPCKTYGAIEDIQDLKKDSRGDYTEAAQRKYFDERVGYKDVVGKYQQCAPGTKALVFCIDQEHTRKTCEEFRKRGISADYLISDEGDAVERKRKLRAFKTTPEIQVLCNCGILTTGYDNPSVETIILNRKTNSLPLFFQMCGRGSRPSPGKTHLKIIDMFSNFVQHGQWDTPRDWVSMFTHPPQPGKVPTKQCPRCEKYVPLTTHICHTPVANPDGSIGICGYTWDVQECIPKAPVDSKAFEEVPKDLFVPQKQVYAMNIEELIEYANEKQYHKMWVFHKARARGYDAVEEFARVKGYKAGWIRMQVTRRKEKLWGDIKEKYNGQSQQIGEAVKDLIKQQQGDFFKAEEIARRQYL